jgi:hypothetical protein
VFGERLTLASAVGSLVILAGVLMTTVGRLASGGGGGGGGKAEDSGAAAAAEARWQALPTREEEDEAGQGAGRDCERGWPRDGDRLHLTATGVAPHPDAPHLGAQQGGGVPPRQQPPCGVELAPQG